MEQQQGLTWGLRVDTSDDVGQELQIYQALAKTIHHSAILAEQTKATEIPQKVSIITSLLQYAVAQQALIGASFAMAAQVAMLQGVMSRLPPGLQSQKTEIARPLMAMAK